MKRRRFSVGLLTVLLFVCSLARGDESPKPEAEEVYPVAVLPFQDRGGPTKGYADRVTELVFAALASDAQLYLVDRSDLEKTLKEQQINLSGLIAPDQATRIGQLTGAKILVTGSVLESGTSLYLVAKMIGTETTRVLGASVKGGLTDDLGALCEQLSRQVATTIQQRSKQLVAEPESERDYLRGIAAALGDRKRPPLAIDVQERHIGQAASDPAAETELSKLATESGFEVFTKAARDRAEVLIVGEGFSEIAGRQGELVSVKVRLEVQATERTTGRVLATDRQTVVIVDVAEAIAGKRGLERAAAEIAERLLPKLGRES